jgi:hypothetical protein
MCRRRSPSPPAKHAITAAAVQPCHCRRKIVQRGHRKTVLRVSSGTIKIVWRPPQDSPARPPAPQDSLARVLQGSLSAVQRDCQDSPAGSVRQSGATAAAGSGGLFGRAAPRVANLASTNLRGTVEAVPRGRPTSPFFHPAHRPPRGRVTADNICSYSYPYVCYIYVQFSWAIRVFTSLDIPVQY